MGSMSDGLIVHGLDSRVLYASQRALDLLDVPETLDGKMAPQILEILRDRLEDPDGTYTAWAECTASGGGGFDFAF